MTRAEIEPLPPDARARVVAVVRPLRVDAVMEALCALGLSDVVVEQVRGYGRQKTHLSFYEEQGQGAFLPKVRLELTVDAARLSETFDAIRRAARTGRIGDGKIFAHLLDPCAAPEPAP